MIVKRVPNPRIPSPKASRIGNLLDYIEAGAEEKVELRFATGDFITESRQGQRAEMIALAIEAKRSKDPIDHWLFSWKAGEQPSESDCRRAVETLKKHLGMSVDHQAVSVLHRNTENLHLHVVLNRTDPRTFRVADKGWSIDRAHQALAEIVEQQGWEPEAHALYGAGGAGSLHNEPMAKPGTKARDYENTTGAKSGERLAIEEAPQLLRAARTWVEVHTSLAAKGMRYEQKGSGALLWVGDVAVKASTVGREFSRKHLEERFGPFQQVAVEPAPRGPVPLSIQASEPWQEYQSLLRSLEGSRARAHTAQRSAHRSARKDQFSQFRYERGELFAGKRWSGMELNVARSLLAADQAKRKAELISGHNSERIVLNGALKKKPSYEDFLRSAGLNQIAEAWRYRGNEKSGASISGTGVGKLGAGDIRDFSPRVEQDEASGRSLVNYYGSRDPQQASFADRGQRIDIYLAADRVAVMAALQVASQKWGLLTITGPPEFEALCAELAQEQGFRIHNVSSASLGLVSRHVDREVANPSRPNSLYELHRADILNKLTVKNPSQLDWMIALRLRVTGHTQEAVARELELHVRKVHQDENRDWARYARRTADAAFGPQGDRESLNLEGRAPAWRTVEGASASSGRQSVAHGTLSLGRQQRKRDLEIGD